MHLRKKWHLNSYTPIHAYGMNCRAAHPGLGVWAGFGCVGDGLVVVGFTGRGTCLKKWHIRTLLGTAQSKQWSQPFLTFYF
jgi:hypothetical protein